MQQSERDRILESIRERITQGVLTVDAANVEMVKAERVRLVMGRMPAQVRKALNAAVKSGVLGHFPKDNMKPESYFHPEFDYLAKQKRGDVEGQRLLALKSYRNAGSQFK